MLSILDDQATKSTDRRLDCARWLHNFCTRKLNRIRKGEGIVGNLAGILFLLSCAISLLSLFLGPNLKQFSSSHLNPLIVLCHAFSALYVIMIFVPFVLAPWINAHRPIERVVRKENFPLSLLRDNGLADSAKHPSRYTIRPATYEDIEWISRRYDEFFVSDNLSIEEREKNLYRILSRNCNSIRVIDKNAQPVGVFCVLPIKPNTAKLQLREGFTKQHIKAPDIERGSSPYICIHSMLLINDFSTEVVCFLFREMFKAIVSFLPPAGIDNTTIYLEASGKPAGRIAETFGFRLHNKSSNEGHNIFRLNINRVNEEEDDTAAATTKILRKYHAEVPRCFATSPVVEREGVTDRRDLIS